MTEHKSRQLESQVVDSLKRMLPGYQHINGLAQQMLVKQAKGESIQSEMEALQLQRAELDKIQDQALPARTAYRNSRATASSAVKALTNQTSTLIKEVMAKIAALEDAAKESYERLVPQINQNVRGNQMKQAYRNSAPS